MKYLKWFVKAMKPYRMRLIVTIFCHILIAGCSIAFVYVSKKLVDEAVAVFAGEGNTGSIWIWAAVMVGIALLRILFNASRTYLQSTTEIRFKNRRRKRLFNILLHLQGDGGARHHTGDVLNRLQEDVRVVASAYAVSLPNLVGTVLQLAAALVFLMILDVRLALVIVVVVPSGLLLAKFISGRVRRLTHDIRKNDSHVQAHLQESLQHISVLQSLEYTDASSSVLEGLQGNLYGSELRRTRFNVMSRGLMSLALQTGHVTAFLWGVAGISSGAVTYGMMTAFLQLVGQIQRPLVEMGSQIPALIHSFASVDRLMELEELPREKVDEPVLLDGVAGIRLSDVSYSYPDAKENVLDAFCYDFAPGSRTAVVGPTGAGKSTLIKLLLSLLRPVSGRIEVYDDRRSEEVSAATRINLVYVPQGNSLFSGTIRDNLLMGNPEATEDQLKQALHTAAADFVLELPSGLDTQCFEAGAGLSEGQAQRIAIARALLRPGSVLLLDEFSSALDAQTEAILMERLTICLQDHTMIFITHREKIIDYCDSILRIS
jgi:ABC-type multidrug transport system fused ATPase/permease subunit